VTGLEAAFAALVFAALGRWLKRVIVHVMLPWKKWGQPPDPAGVRREDGFWTAEVDKLVGWLESHATGGQGFSTSAQVRGHMDRVRNLLVRVPDEVFQDIRRELVQGHDQGESTRAIADKINRILDVSGSENWRNRAQVIAVTEVNGALNAGWFGGAVTQQSQLGQPLAKKWIATHDSHTRHDHRQADGQIVPLLSPFIVGDSPLLYPGDKAGPPEQVINCRCTAAIVEAQ
jgi:F like protein